MIEKGLNLLSGNKLENLVMALSKVLEMPLANVFTKETIIVQSQGMSRWISLSLAGYHGISANIGFKFPNAFIYEILSKLSPHKSDLSLFEPEIMTWKIMAFLSELIGEEEFITLKNYLGGSNSELKKYQLATLISDTFDQYLLFRPKMIQEWETGKENHWQAILWRKLVNENEDIHRVELLARFKKAIALKEIKTDSFPERISVFGISSLPAFHMEIFDLLSDYMQVNLFLLNPCEQYWGDIVSESEAKRIKSKVTAEPAEDIYLEQGNSLLSSMGTLGRDFFDLINDFNHESIALFEPPGYNSLLSAIQSDIFMLSNHSGIEDPAKKIDSDDKSVEVHSCHSPMREVEVLKDSLYDMLAKDEELTPRDILVMTPDIELFSPLIKSVFDKGAGAGSRLPYSIADRSLRNESRIIETFLALFEFANGRFAVSEVVNILETAAVRDRFEISEKDLELISLWIHDTKIRWGKDGEHRCSLGLPDFEENSWVEGLKQMILGYAMPGDGETLYNGILPYNNIEGDIAELLGKFCEFTDAVFLFAGELDKARDSKGWQFFLNQSLESFFARNDDNQKELQIIRDEINKIVDVTELAEYTDGIEFSVIRHYLNKKLDSSETGFGFIAGGITFCAMLPMRSIPFKVICAIGMNSDVYPRQTRAAGFDLIAQHPARGDRSRRKDDRYLFLEILLSARKKLYLSYTGQSIKDNSIIQPSVIISELVDYINDAYVENDAEASSFEIINHPLQAFNYRYFNGSDNNLFSYSDENYRAAVEYFSNDRAVDNFISENIPAPEKEIFEIDINDLCLFFKNPSKYLLENRFGLFLNRASLTAEEDEPFEIDWLERYKLTNNIAEKMIAGQMKEDYYQVVKASGVLPYGQAGKNDFRVMKNEVEAFTIEMERLIAGRDKTTIDVNLEIAGVCINGSVDGVYGSSLINYRYAKIKGKDILDFWIKYLILTIAGEKTGGRYDGCLVGFEGGKSGKGLTGYRLNDVDASKKTLEIIINLYRSGMSMPLPFFSESSMKFAEVMQKKESAIEDALAKAYTVWAGNQFSGRGECKDPYFDLCFKQNNPLNEAFIDNSLAVFEPVFRNIEKIN